jgi:hypothetical protein
MALMVAAVPAQADTASAQIQALWAKMATEPDLKDVDQVIIEGDANWPNIRGTLEKRKWADPDGNYQSKPFWARIEQQCSFAIPQCFKVVGIWSRGHLLAGE